VLLPGGKFLKRPLEKMHLAQRILGKSKRAFVRLTNLMVGKFRAIAWNSKRGLQRALGAIVGVRGYALILRVWNELRNFLFPYQPGVRMYLKRGLTVQDFLAALNQANVSYVVLRWFEELPDVRHGEDIDILVDDTDLALIRSFCVAFDNNNQKMDIYSVTGRDNSKFHGTSYFPQHMAEKLLAESTLLNETVKVPSDKMYLASFIYHLVVHKGEAAGLPCSIERNGEVSYIADHDYLTDLKSMFALHKIDSVDLTFEGLLCYLQDNNWLPEFDTLSLLARDNQWLREKLEGQLEGRPRDKGDIIVFVLRSWVLENGFVEFIINEIKNAKLDIVSIDQLDEAEGYSISKKMRGGQWGKGPYPVGGGIPRVLVTCFDYTPQFIDADGQLSVGKNYNANINLKYYIRDAVNRDQFLWNQTNCLHSADNETEARDYIGFLGPEKEAHILAEIKRRRASSFFAERDVEEVLTANGTRARTEIIRHKGRKAVIKVFKPGCERFLARELFVYQNFAAELDCLPTLLDHGDDYFITEYCENVLLHKSHLQQREQISSFTEEILLFLKFFYDQGFAVIGFYPGNLIIDGNNKIKMIDFEFLHRYVDKPDHFSKSYDLAGVPRGFEGDVPRGDKNHTLGNTWRPYFDMKLAKYLLHKIDRDKPTKN
jgi:hypothetical protein